VIGKIVDGARDVFGVDGFTIGVIAIVALALLGLVLLT
jgi:hypothetical protein